MTGVYLKEYIRKNNVSQSELARRLGLSQSSFNQMLTSNDVKSSLVERIAVALHVSIGVLYKEQLHEQTAVATGNSIVVLGNNNVVGNITINDNMTLLWERVTLLERLLDEKERTIQILMKRGWSFVKT